MQAPAGCGCCGCGCGGWRRRQRAAAPAPDALGSGKTTLLLQLQELRSPSAARARRRARATVAPEPPPPPPPTRAPPPQPTVGTELVRAPTGRRRAPRRLLLREVGGQMAPLWPAFFAEAAAVVFVVDARAPEALPRAAGEIAKALEHPGTQGKPVCIFFSASRASGGGAAGEPLAGAAPAPEAAEQLLGLAELAARHPGRIRVVRDFASGGSGGLGDGGGSGGNGSGGWAGRSSSAALREAAVAELLEWLADAARAAREAAGAAGVRRQKRRGWRQWWRPSRRAAVVPEG
ncbi:hypothetical protein Rsub_07463 [Raphidocelis subcapitata]|uniref:Uncharacterized protein n=1 Tax=Raphidocelis subcapitata TaxID=307507 RepID=A0A2V0P7Q8_9CHLO|nr:hypothetical protein Rsub_07463 [Raphidocelis subcapitata]|eukprot:GBF94962.1 hypothetical protein Rsub_07463 [Raphidocelis subcapitata]